jgi:hypothetical protein
MSSSQVDWTTLTSRTAGEMPLASLQVNFLTAISHQNREIPYDLWSHIHISPACLSRNFGFFLLFSHRNENSSLERWCISEGVRWLGQSLGPPICSLLAVCIPLLALSIEEHSPTPDRSLCLQLLAANKSTLYHPSALSLSQKYDDEVQLGQGSRHPAEMPFWRMKVTSLAFLPLWRHALWQEKLPQKYRR